ncbi:MAG: YezD family protein [Armatimonadetes bacterium]|nr:YezD family protein [Armatimonadota bacterium]
MAEPGSSKSQEQRELIALRHIRDAIRKIRYGTVTILVQDGVVIQIDQTDKIRLDYSREEVQADGSGI